MIILTCRSVPAAASATELRIVINDPKPLAGSPNGDYQCTLELDDLRSMPIAGISPIDSIANALKVAEAFAAARFPDGCEWA
jgi:hypothetical protein